MKPEYAVFIPLLVVGFALIWRFVAWVFRPAEPKAEPAVQKAKPSPVATAAPAEVPAPKPAAAIPAEPAPVPPAAVQPSRPAAPEYVAPEYVAPAVIPAALRAALAPSVAATIAPRSIVMPRVAATLPPLPPVESIAVAVPPPPMVQAAVAQQPAAPLALAAAAEMQAADDGPLPKTVRLRARKIGTEVTPLDIRLRHARERRILQVAKVSRSSDSPDDTKALRVLAPKAEPAKAPTRRIGRKVGDLLSLVSTSSRTRVVGTSGHRFRVLGFRDLAAPSV